MKVNLLKYFTTLIVFAIALIAGWWMWNYYMQSPWTRDGKIRAELVNITPEVSGRIISVNVTDNQFVRRGDLLVTLDEVPLKIAVDNAQALLARSQADLLKARHEQQRRARLPKNIISAEDMDIARQTADAMQASEKAAQASLDKALWDLQRTKIYAPVDGWITNLTLRAGNYASEGSPLFALLDSHSYYVMGYFEETKLRHIRDGDPARIVLYSNGDTLTGTVLSIGRAIYDQNIEADGLVPEIKPTVPWVRLAQRVPVRIRLDKVPDNIQLVAGTTCTIVIRR
ncbi:MULTISPECIES: HlyD family secretion protein [Tatumella]|uniref:Efflux RND transporter periplasmic adaptor subunit n=1 Tax=Tatumella punctata TaxID=399969 RepID=A0ABW1VJ37_9GAMM|nr:MULTISPECIES: HlyD family secretion protein [unclassified Tatumella]MBS0855047.1 HlyD family secretion protein [Tatumella sp. JGM16]MBS0876078.1 HlyD family secretion protein [Tatumella sp. JGM82]MBS0890552.1 HlyD family secretion protein [Tatumella sp. JGM94]MBS0892663.1 HlyD family secretion protein [Tatumella sp. JGM130]MBS0901008.1 HlyD family secretion protein [Tatumella sp. JGM100]